MFKSLVTGLFLALATMATAAETPHRPSFRPGLLDLKPPLDTEKNLYHFRNTCPALATQLEDVPFEARYTEFAVAENGTISFSDPEGTLLITSVVTPANLPLVKLAAESNHWVWLVFTQIEPNAYIASVHLKPWKETEPCKLYNLPFRASTD